MSPIDPPIHDILIIGAGPASLALASRLSCPTPAALFTDEEHRRYHWLRRHGRHVPLKSVHTGHETPRTPYSDALSGYKMLIIDADAQGANWLGRWKRLFGAYEISHLRSPLPWHVDPRERDGLLAFAWEKGREKELFDIQGCVGQEIPKHHKKKRSTRRGGIQDGKPKVLINRRDHADYYTPSLTLFIDHCHSIRDRYRLASSSLLRHETLLDLKYSPVPSVSITDEPLFTITTNKAIHYARTVALAVGPANAPCIPHIPVLSPQPTFHSDGTMNCEPLPQARHTFNITKIPEPMLAERIAAGNRTNLLIIGGGLTSVQITDVALRCGVSKVYLLMRSGVKIKYFDVDLSWMGKYKNSEQACFWSADSDVERLKIFHEAREGGSITPYYHKKLKGFINKGQVSLHTFTKLSEAIFDKDVKRPVWKVKTEPPTAEPLPPMDYIYFATGIDTDFRTLPYLQQMIKDYPIEEMGGFPCVTEDLMWNDDVPLFVTGKLASLKIGPASPNLGGIKIATERIGLAIEEYFAKLAKDTQLRPFLGSDNEVGVNEEEEEENHALSYAVGEGSKYQILATCA